MVAHVLVFPFPVQGDINCMLSFAAGLLHAGLHVTFLHSDHNRRRLGLATAESSPSSSRLRFLSVPDGLPDDHPRSAGGLAELNESLRTNTSVAYRALLQSLCAPDQLGHGFPPVTCVVADGMLPFAIDVAEDLGVPALAFRTASACSFLAYLSVPNLVELGEVPVPAGAADLDAPVRGVPGMEGFLRRRDLPSFCRGHDENGGGLDPLLQIFHEVTAHSSKARALIFNTAASLERSALAHVAPRMGDVFAIGPLHAMFQAPAAGGGALWREDDGCTAWLDGHADRSVVYVSLGSLAVISLEQFTEFLCGLVGAGHPFLWVLRPDMAGGPRQSAVLQEAIRAAGRSKARVVDWAPQRDVLRHRAVGCFLTHAGWNSTLECVAEGVPTVCWPFFADQQTNSRFVDAVWGTGLDMKDSCERAVVEGMVRRAMESGELRGSAQALAQEVTRDIAEGGSSATEFKRLHQPTQQPGAPNRRDPNAVAVKARSLLRGPRVTTKTSFSLPSWPHLASARTRNRTSGGTRTAHPSPPRSIDEHVILLYRKKRKNQQPARRRQFNVSQVAELTCGRPKLFCHTTVLLLVSIDTV